MKQIMIILTALFAMICTGACSTGGNNSSVNTAETAGSLKTETSKRESKKTEAQPELENDGKNIPQDSESSGSKILVAYFSATNTTEGVTYQIAEITGADIYEILPAEPYSSADLDWNDSKSRSSIEMNDKSSRPGISGTADNWENYDVVFLGYPIWWGDAPRIMSTFVESCDFSGKTVIPFCTSGSSGIGSSGSNLEKLAGGGNWLSGKRIGADDNISDWVNSLDY